MDAQLHEAYLFAGFECCCHAAAVHHDVADEMPTAMMKVMLAHGDGGPGIGTDARTCGSVTVMVIMILLTATKRSIMPSCLA